MTMNPNTRSTDATAVTPPSTQRQPGTSSASGATVLRPLSLNACRPKASAPDSADLDCLPASKVLRGLLLVTFLGAVLLVPSAPYAATLAAPLGLRALTESELAAVSGQGETQNASRSAPRLVRLASLSSDKVAPPIQGSDAQALSPQAQSTVKVLQDVGKLLHPQGKILQANITMNDVVYDTADRTAIANADGSITFVLPKTIGHISVQDVRISGSNGPGFGNIDIRGIDLRGTRVSVRSY